MRSLQFTQDTSSPECTVFTLTGEFVLDHLFAVQNALRADTAPLTIVDMTAVAYVDSAAIGALVNAQVSRQGKGRRLILAGVQDRVKGTLEITKVAQLFTFADGVAAAKVRGVYA